VNTEEITLKGVWPVLAIPFLDNGEVDEQSLRREIDFELEQGVDGLVLFGLASETYKLSEQERVQLVEITVSHVRNRVPIIAGTEHTGSEVAAERSYQAQELGISGVMVYPPTFVRPDVAGIVEYYQLISDRIRIPLMVQDAQAWTQVPLPIELLAFLYREVPAVQYVKVETVPTGPKISKLLEAAEGRLGIFGGYGGLHYLDEIERGALGTLIPAGIPDWFIRIHKSFHEGDVDTAERLHGELLPFLLFEMATLDTLIEIQKIMLQRAGIFRTSVVRRPHTPLDSHQRKRLDRWLHDLDFTLLHKG
jgi:4-hydroxy-tetrahydrodipicolinate synthase